MNFVEAYNGSVATSTVSRTRSPIASAAGEPRFPVPIGALAVAISEGRGGRHRRGTVAVVVRLMGCAFLRLLSQPADYDMLVVPATERRRAPRYPIPRASATVTPFARLMTRGHLAAGPGPFVAFPGTETALFEGKVSPALSEPGAALCRGVPLA